MLDKFGAFLGTKAGFWLTMALTALCCVVALWQLNPATFALSVVAIILPSIVLVRAEHAGRMALDRDRAMHKKLDSIIEGTDADDALKGIEPEPDE